MKEIKKATAYLLTMIMVLTLAIMDQSVNTQAAAKKYVKSVSVSKSVTVEKGKKKTVSVKVKVAGKANKKVTVKVKDKKIAKASYNAKKSEITVTGVKKGSTKITVTTKGKNKKGKKITKTINVKVSDAQKTTTEKTTQVTTEQNKTEATTEKTTQATTEQNNTEASTDKTTQVTTEQNNTEATTDKTTEEKTTEQNKYTITYDANGGYFPTEGSGDEAVARREIESGTQIVPKTKFGDDDYTNICAPKHTDAHKLCVGWRVDGDETLYVGYRVAPPIDGQKWIGEYTVTGDVTFVAQWTEGCIITYDANGGSRFSVSYDESIVDGGIHYYEPKYEFCYEETYTQPAGIGATWPSTFYRKGKILTGWKTEGDDILYIAPFWGNLEEPKEGEQYLDYYKVDRDVNFVAQWTDAYNVLFDANGGYFSEEIAYGCYDSDYIKDGVWIKHAYELAKGEAVSQIMRHFRYNGASFESCLENADSDKTFIGWKVDDDDTVYVSSEEDATGDKKWIGNYVPKEDVTFVAQWVENSEYEEKGKYEYTLIPNKDAYTVDFGASQEKAESVVIKISPNIEPIKQGTDDDWWYDYDVNFDWSIDGKEGLISGGYELHSDEMGNAEIVIDLYPRKEIYTKDLGVRYLKVYLYRENEEDDTKTILGYIKIPVTLTYKNN